MQSVAVLRLHPLIRRDPPAWPFLWGGFTPLLALAFIATFALGPAAKNWIEGSVERETREQLTAAGLAWVRLAVSGQEVTLSGEEPSAGAGERALALVTATRCWTWIGAYPCATQVLGHFTAPAPPPPPMPLPPTAALAAPETATQACDRALAGALAGGQIEFALGHASIDARSAPILDRLAQEARACSGIIRIEGHTDTIGRGAI